MLEGAVLLFGLETALRDGLIAAFLDRQDLELEFGALGKDLCRYRQYIRYRPSLSAFQRFLAVDTVVAYLFTASQRPLDKNYSSPA